MRSGRAILVLFDRRPFENHAFGVDTLTRLVGRPQSIRTGETYDVALALGDGIGEPTKKPLRLLGLIPHGRSHGLCDT